MIKQYKRKYDCINYNACLTRAAINDQPLKCSGCRQYKSIRLEFVDPFANHEDVTIHLADSGVLFSELDEMLF